jgi:hypothetical protein
MLGGAFSVNPFGMFSGTPMTREQRQVVTGPPIGIEPITLRALRTAVAVLTESFPAKEIDLMQFRGEQYLIATRPLSFEHRIVSLAHPERGTFKKFDDGIMMDIADEAMVGVPEQDAVWLRQYDNYWRSREGARNLPVLRVRYLDEQKTWLYLDPHRGTMSKLEWIERRRAQLHDLVADVQASGAPRPPFWPDTPLVCQAPDHSSGCGLMPMPYHAFAEHPRWTGNLGPRVS